VETQDGEEEHINAFFNQDEAARVTKYEAEKIKADSWEVMCIDFAEEISSDVI